MDGGGKSIHLHLNYFFCGGGGTGGGKTLYHLYSASIKSGNKKYELEENHSDPGSCPYVIPEGLLTHLSQGEIPGDKENHSKGGCSK